MQIVTTLNIGGLEKLVLDLARKIDRQSFQISVCCFSRNGQLRDEFQKIDVPVFTVEKKDKVDWMMPLRLRSLFKQERPDVIHTHNIDPYLYGTLAAKMSGVRAVIHTEHSNIPMNKWWLARAERFLSWMSHKIVADSKKVGNFLVKQQNIPPQHILVIYNGVDMDKFKREMSVIEKKATLGINSSTKVIICVANLLPVKNHKMLLRAFRRVLDVFPDIVLLLAGDGKCRVELEAMSKELNLSDNALFLGRRNDIPELVSTADVFALSSVSEGLPISVLEALAAGKPVVITDVGGNSEIIQDGITGGYLVTAGDAEGMAERIIELLSDRQKALELGAHGGKRIEEKFSLVNMVEQYQQLYLKAMVK